MYKLGCKKLKKAGYHHYEVSSFALKGREAVHNQLYWNNQEYLGFGSGAYSYLKGERFAKTRNILEYEKQAISGKIKKYEKEKLDDKQRLLETVILRLRLLKGFSLSDIEKTVGIKAGKHLRNKLENFISQRLIVNSKGKYRLSQKGILYYDTIASELL